MRSRCQDVTYDAIRRGCIGAPSSGRSAGPCGTPSDERTPASAAKEGLRRAVAGGGRRSTPRHQPATWSVREDVGGVVELKAGHGPWTRGWCAGRCSGRSERVISLAGRPACHLREMKGRAHRRNGCFWRYASLNQPAKTARRSLLDAPHSGRQIISAQSQTAMGVEPHPWALDLTSGNPGHQVLSKLQLSPRISRKTTRPRWAQYDHCRNKQAGGAYLVGRRHRQRAFAPITEKGLRLFLHKQRRHHPAASGPPSAIVETEGCGSRAEWLYQCERLRSR